MACSRLTYPQFAPFFSINPLGSHTRRRRLRRRFSMSCNSDQSDPSDRRNPNRNPSKLLELSVTLTVLSSSLPLSSAIAAPAKTSGRKRKSTKTEAFSPEELRSWSRDLPTVADRIPYTELLNLKQEGKLKHIIKLPSSNLKQRPESVFVVLDDSKVLRTVLPSVVRDAKFWNAWDQLNLNSACISAYTPPVPKPEIPSPYLGFLSNLQSFLLSLVVRKPQSKRALELERARKELQQKRKVQLAREREEKEMMEKAMREEERKRNRELRKAKHEEKLLQAQMSNEQMSLLWNKIARNQNVTTLFGIAFLCIFYQTVILSYKKNQKDYEDRRKIEKAEAEENMKVKQLERELAGMEDFDNEDENEGKEKDPYREIMKFMKSGAYVRRADRKRLPQYMDKDVDVKFSDVAGLGKLQLELEEVVKFFTHGDIYRRRGVRIPGGILLSGSPGVGKTLLAKAVAGEAGVNFFSISASQFVEIYVGVGASRVRALYQEAKQYAPSVVFIDELDAVGRKRGQIKGSGGQERDATLNQLLVCLDGFEGRGNVITIAATNRPDILDKALVRPGRFDRKIHIPKPGLIGRMEILKVHARKKPMADDVDYRAVAGISEGMAGAELANIVEVAAMNIMRDGRPEVTTDDLIQAVHLEERGMLDKKERSPETWRQLALYEASMAVVAVNFPDVKNVEFITIAPRAGSEIGYVRMKVDHMKFGAGMLSRQSALDHITVQLAPRAADAIWNGEDKLSTIWAETANTARSAARSFVLGGLSEKYYGLAYFWTADRLNEIDLEALRILNICYDRAKQILLRNKRLMDATVDELIQKKSLTKQEFFQLVEANGLLEPLPTNIIDIRTAKRAEFQEKLMSEKEAITSSSS